jgi:dTDP-glucose 4,6-dehydratase
MKRVLITGVGGAIGVHVFAHLMKNTDWHVVGIDSFRHKGYPERITEILRAHPEWASRLTIYQHDLVCPIPEVLKQKIGDVSHIIHLAAISDVQYSVENPRYTVVVNTESTMTMLDYARETEHDSFVYFSTDEVYGPVRKGEAHKEWDVMRPSNPYSASKGAGELFAHVYWRAGWVKLILTNTMNNFGEMQGATKYPAMVQRKLENDEEVTVHGSEKEIGSRYYIHSRNTADALLFILKNLPPHAHKEGELDEPDRYHIVGDECLNNLELAQLIAELMGKKLKYKLVDFHKDNPAHDIHYGLQDNKLKAAGWRAPLSLKESMRNTIAWQQEHKDWV